MSSNEETQPHTTSPSTISWLSNHSNYKVDKQITAELTLCSLHILRFNPNIYIEKYQLKYASSYGNN